MKRKTFTVENVPATVQLEMDAAKAMGGTRPTSIGGKLTGYSRVYFNKNLAFSSAKQMFRTFDETSK